MTSHLDSHRTISGVQTGNGTPHDKYNIRGIAHVRTNRKDDIFMKSAKLHIYVGFGQRDLYIDEAHTALDIFCFVAFFSVTPPHDPSRILVALYPSSFPKGSISRPA